MSTRRRLCSKHQALLWRRCRGVCAKVNIPSTHHNPYLPHYIICHLPLVFLSPQFTLAVLFSLSLSILPLYFPLLPVCSLFARVEDCLFVVMAQDTKLCDFSNTNNYDFISTPISPTTDAESCEINTALLNLGMKLIPTIMIFLPLRSSLLEPIL